LNNIDRKIDDKLSTEKINEDKKINVFITTSDFTVQNVALKMGIPVMSLDGLKIKHIRNYILKCYTCNTFIFDTSKLFCNECGYNTLMKIGYSLDSSGKITIYDKKADPRNRGTQYDLPKPSTDKKASIYILAEDQLPKKRNCVDLDKELDKILDDYDAYKDLSKNVIGSTGQNSSKRHIWGYPKNNPNIAKKYYSKKHKK